MAPKELTVQPLALGWHAITATTDDGIIRDVAKVKSINDARLFVNVFALLATLEAIEWVMPPWPAIGHEAFCPWCGNYQVAGHREDCARQAAIAKARGG